MIKKTLRLKYRFKITAIKDGKAKVFRFDDESAVRMFIRLKGYNGAEKTSVSGVFSRYHKGKQYYLPAKRVFHKASRNLRSDMAIVIDRHGGPFLDTLLPTDSKTARHGSTTDAWL